MGYNRNTVFVGKRVFTVMTELCKPCEISDNQIRIGSVSFVKHNLLADLEMCTDDPLIAPVLADMKASFNAKSAGLVQGVTPPVK